jgi:Ca2+-binding EF-hand superfamily protein
MASDEQLEKEFKRIDKDKSGSITVEELRSYYLPMQEMLGIAPQLAEQEIQGLVRRLDLDGNGNISLEGKERIFFNTLYYPSTNYVFFLF